MSNVKIYGRETDADEPETVRVTVADFAVAEGPVTFTTSGLGSCVGVALYDSAAAVAGLAHVMLPASEAVADDNEAKFADTAIPAMLAAMDRRGADLAEVRAKIAGGSNLLDFTSLDGAIGTRNVEAVEATLAERDVPIEAADVGGEHGRSLRFDAETETLRVRSATEGVIEL